MLRIFKRGILSLFVPAVLIAVVACPGVLIDNIQFSLGPGGAIVGGTITFTCISPTGLQQEVSYLWSFGDGGTASGKTVIHVYQTSGDYVVECKVIKGDSVIVYSRTITIDTLLSGQVYVVNRDANNVSVLDIETNTNTGTTIPTGDTENFIAVSQQIAITSDGTRAYVVNYNDGDVSILDLTTNTNIGPDIDVGNGPTAIALNEATNRAYVANVTDDSTSVIDLNTNTEITTIATGNGPFAIAINTSTNRLM